MSATSTPNAPTFVAKTQGGRITNFVDERVGGSGILREFGRKVFPDHWSFMFGEVALYSFVILLLSGTFLTFFFDPSMAETHYQGSYTPLKNVEMSVAYSSSLDISFDVRGGLFMRQVHHWSALLFVASVSVHMLRVFFTGAFRKPREMNWVVGGVLLILSMAAGFTGYSLPDDLLSGNGLRIIDGVIKSIPGGRNVHLVLPLRRRIPRHGHHRPPVHAPHPAGSGTHPPDDRPAPLYGGRAQAHPVPRPGTQRRQRRRLPAGPGLRSQGRRLLLHRVRCHRPHGGLLHHQPDLELRPLRPLPRFGGHPA